MGMALLMCEQQDASSGEMLGKKRECWNIKRIKVVILEVISVDSLQTGQGHMNLALAPWIRAVIVDLLGYSTVV